MLNFIITTTLIVSSLSAWTGDYNEAMIATLAKEKTASTFEEVESVATRFAEIADAHRDQWEASYWAAFAYSQCWVFSADRTQSHHLKKALAHLRLAELRYPTRWESDESEFVVLESLIYALWAGQANATKRPEDATFFRGLSFVLLDRAEKADQKNPRVRMLRAIAVFNRPETREQGIAEMRAALEIYNRFQLKTPLSPNWGRSFLEYRFQQLEKKTAK